VDLHGFICYQHEGILFFFPLKVDEVATDYFRIILFRMSFIVLLDLEDSFSEYVPLFEIFWQYWGSHSVISAC
jgi:hypothetical protein